MWEDSTKPGDLEEVDLEAKGMSEIMASLGRWILLVGTTSFCVKTGYWKASNLPPPSG
jgi:hypothetical protein